MLSCWSIVVCLFANDNVPCLNYTKRWLEIVVIFEAGGRVIDWFYDFISITTRAPMILTFYLYFSVNNKVFLYLHLTIAHWTMNYTVLSILFMFMWKDSDCTRTRTANGSFVKLISQTSLTWNKPSITLNPSASGQVTTSQSIWSERAYESDGNGQSWQNEDKLNLDTLPFGQSRHLDDPGSEAKYPLWHGTESMKRSHSHHWKSQDDNPNKMKNPLYHQ